jgi:hypothetical protein
VTVTEEDESMGTPIAKSMPVPPSVTFTVGCAGSLLLITSDEDRPFAAAGVNVTLMLQLPAAATLAPHPFVCAKSAAFAPVSPRLVMDKAALPVFDRVTVCAALVVFTSWLANVSDAGDTPATGLMPVPFRDATWGLPAASSVTVSEPLLGPRAVGVKVTLMEHPAPTAKVAGGTGQVFVSAKSLLAARPSRVRGAVPRLVRVNI